MQDFTRKSVKKNAGKVFLIIITVNSSGSITKSNGLRRFCFH